MQKMIKLVSTYLLISTIVITGLAFCLSTQAEEVQVSEEIALEQEVSAQDLGVKDPWLLPDNYLYFIKDWNRGIQSFFTFNSIKKAELKSKFANERLIEIKKMAEDNKESEIIEKATENYKKEIERIREIAGKIKEKAKDNPEINSFLDKFSEHQILHQKILDKLENQVPEKAFQKIREAREQHLEKFGEIMTKLEDRKDKIKERLEDGLQKIKGSEFKDFKNLEILQELEEKFPNEAKETIQEIREKILENLQESLEKTPIQNQARFQNYIEKIDGDKETHLEIIENLEAETEKLPETPRNLQLRTQLKRIKSSLETSGNE
jgi:hypothetical protein